MKGTDLSKIATEELVLRFVEIAIAQDKAMLYDDTKAFNRLYRRMDVIDEELRARGTEARRALVSLYEHANLQVRLKAATRTLGIEPIAARRVLEEIRDSKELPQALDAGMTIDWLDSGEYKPT